MASTGLLYDGRIFCRLRANPLRTGFPLMPYLQLTGKSVAKLEEWIQHAKRLGLDPMDIRLHAKVSPVEPVVNSEKDIQ